LNLLKNKSITVKKNRLLETVGEAIRAFREEVEMMIPEIQMTR
jgi:hypothetical protein